MASSLAPGPSMLMDIQDRSQRALPPRETEDREIVDIVLRLFLEKELNVVESCALLHVLQVDPEFWPDSFAKTFQDAFQQAEEYGNEHKWQWSDEERKNVAGGGLQDMFLLKRADSIAWAQRFVLGYTSKNLEGYLEDTHGRYPAFMDSFHLNVKDNRKTFIDVHNPKPFEPPDEKSDGKGSGGSGGMGFLIGAVVIALLAFAILMYFLLR
jgi:hypothetical protein